jgi:hypothetical protein
MPEANLELLQALMQRMLAGLANLQADFDDMKVRQTAFERHLAGLRRDAVLDAEATIGVREQMERLGERVGGIERRLGLSDA